jgi:hypothetical protein
MCAVAIRGRKRATLKDSMARREGFGRMVMSEGVEDEVRVSEAGQCC